MAIFKIDYKNNHKIINVFGLKIKTNRSLYKKVNKLFERNKNFDCRKFDNQIAQLTDKALENYHFQKNEINNNRIAILATLFYDMGGHTECVKNVAKLLSDKYEIKTFLTSKDEAYFHAPTKIKLIEQCSKIDGINSVDDRADSAKLIDMFEKINEFSPRVLFVYMNPDDCIVTALLYLLKKYTNIKIIYINHASHYPVLGMSFADAIGNTSDSTFYVNKIYRGFDKNVYFNLIDDKKENIVDILEKEKQQIKKDLDIINGNYFTLSGASSYKFFEGEQSPYFEMIRELLKKELKLQHVVITHFNDKEQQIFDKIFKNCSEKSRLKVIDFTPEYSKIFQSCDLFIDSFPMASAFTHVEIMKHKGVSVVKINNKNALYSMHEYFPKDYKYMFSDVSKMEDGIIELLHNPKERKLVGETLYEHYLNNFEMSEAKKAFINIIENSEHIEDFYVHLDENLKFNLEIEK